MHVASFDIFDTLLTRDVAVPRDLFVECGIRLEKAGLSKLEPADFAKLRVEAEIRARKTGPVHEITLAQIYLQLATSNGWSDQEKAGAVQIELEVEALHLHPVPEVVARLSTARSLGKRIVFISDMYLPSTFLRDALTRHGLFREGDDIHVSCEYGCSKSDGRLYECVRGALPGIESWEHIGDNHEADVASATRRGIRATLFDDTRLSRYEAMARGKGLIAPLWRSRLAGAMRLARLRGDGLNHRDSVIWGTACNVTGPLLTGFVQWCLDEARRKGIQRLYFVARDGQILLQIAKRLCSAQSIPVECRYLYGSRQAWRPASIDTISPADWSWLLPPDHHLSVRNVLARVAAEPALIEEYLSQAGFAKTDWDKELSGHELNRLSAVLLVPQVSAILERICQVCRGRLVHYLNQEGFADDVRSSLVDIGWFGNLQRCLDRALKLAKHPAAGRLHGFYFGLFPGAADNRNDMAGYWDRVWSFGGEIQFQSMTLFEIFTAADHGSVTGYRESDGRMIPTLEEEKNSRALRWGLKHLHNGILEFSSLIAQTPLGTTQAASTAWQLLSRRLWREFHDHPSADEVNAWGSFDMSGQSIEKFHLSLAPAMTREETLAAIKDHHRRPTGWWAEGTLALTGDKRLGRFLTLRRWRRALPGLWRRLQRVLRAREA